MGNPVEVNIGGDPFMCLPLEDANFADVAAVYVVICVASDRSWTVLDVGQSGEVGSRIDAHDRRRCWETWCRNGRIWVCIHRMPSLQYTKADRVRFEVALRDRLKPKCGSK